LLIHKSDINFIGPKMSEEDPRVRARVQEILAQRAMLGAGTSVVTSKPIGVEAAKSGSEPRIQEILAQRATVSPVKPVVASNPGVVEAAKPSSEPRIQEILAQRAMVGTGKSVAMGKPNGVEAAKPSTEPRTQAPAELKTIENNMMFTITALGQANNSIARLGTELHMLTTLFKVVLGVGSVGVLLVLWGVLRLANII
jgi:hypothetical protein